MLVKMFRYYKVAQQQKRQSKLPQCPNCGYIQDRPHSLTCMRCRTEIPGASGCSGCGRCQN